MFPVVNSRWRVMGVIPCCSPDPHFAILHPAMPQEAGPSAQILGLLAPTGFIQLGRGRDGREGREGVMVFIPPLLPSLQKYKFLLGSPLCQVLVTGPHLVSLRC